MKREMLFFTTRRAKSNYRLVWWILLLLLLLFLPTKGVNALADGKDNAIGDAVLEQIEKLDTAALEEYLASLGYFSDESLTERLLSYMKGGSLNYGEFFKGLAAVFLENVTAMTPAFSCVVGISLLCGVLSSLKSHIIGQSVSDTVFLVAFAASLAPVLAVLTECFSLARDSVFAMRKQMELIFPLILTLMSASGNSVSAAIYQPAVAFLSTTIVQIVTSIVFPLTVTVIAFSLAGHLSPELKLNRFADFFKSMNKWIVGVSISVFGMFFTVQGLTSATYDGVAKRAAKYALGTGVPIVGGFLAGGFDLAIAGSILIKNSLGTFGIVMMISVIAEPLITLIAVNLLLRLCAAVCEPLGDTRISDFLADTAGNLNYCTAGLLFVAFLYLVTIVLTICSAEVIL